MKGTIFVCLAAAALLASCVKLDFFLYDSGEASLDDYDFTSEDLDGIPPDRITSELIPVGDSGDEMHVIFVKRDVSKLDSRFSPDDGLTVVYSHGNYLNMLQYFYRLSYWEDMGFNVLMYDYRGYGASSGETNENNIYEDVETAYDYAAAQDGVGLLFAVGRSMGGAPTIYLCSDEADRDLAACFVESTFSGTDQLVDDAANFDLVGSWFVDTAFDSVGRIADIDTPFLIMHGTKDQTVDFSNGERLWDAVEGNNPANRFYKVEGATHRNLPMPSYDGDIEPREYSHPDELPPDLHAEYEVYKGRFLDFLVEALEK